MKIRKDKVVMIVSLWVLLTAIIALLGIFSKNSIVVFSVNDKNNIVYDFYASKNNDASGDLDYVYVDFQDERIPNNKSFIVPFKVKSQYGIRNFDYTQVGFLILSSRIINSEQINIELMCSSSADEHSLSLDIKLESDTVLNVQLYAVANETGVYISQFTKDDAYEKYLSFAVSNGLLSESESVRMRMDFCKYSVTEVNYTSNNTSVADLPTSITNEATLLQNQDTYANVTQTDSSANTYIKGKLEWIADDGVIHPLRRVQVKICDYESNVLTQNLGTVFTDNDGNYSFAFENKDKLLDFENGGYDLFIKVYAGDSNVMVVKPNGEDYYYQSDEKANMNVATGSTTTINMKINMSSNLGRAFQISQALITARDFAWNMKGSMPSDATAKYPVDSSGCYYQRENSQISITNRIYDNVPLNSYASWDVIMHEYGHHIEYEMGIIESCGGWHTFPTNMADHYAGANTCGAACARHRDSSPISASQAKYYGMRIAYSEAWATCFGGIAQEYYAKYLSNIATTNNKEYNSYNGAYFNYETADADETDETWTIRRGDSCEGSVMAILWDLYDSGSEENDYISLGYQAWWNLTTGNKDKTLSDLVQSFYFAYPDKISSLGANLSYFKMAPSRVERYSTTLTETPPSFWWLDKGGSETFPNNSFNVFIFSEDYSSYLNIATTEDSITLTEEQWHTVLSWSGATIHIAVMGTQTDQVVSGGYISEHRDYTKPIYITNQVSDGVIITGTHCPIEGSIDIPSTINGKNVVGIGLQAFRNQSELTSVTLPSTIASIGNRAFQFCYKLETINMSSTTVTRIEDYTFDTCAISSISLPSTIAYIGEGAFIRSGMHTYIPTNVTFIGDYAYANVTSTTLIIPSSVSTIGTNAFMGCDKLTLYTTKQDRPSTWNTNWNSSNRPVVWGCSISSEYVTQFTKTTSNPSNINATNGISNPYRNGYTFGGWYAESDYSGTQYMDLAAAPNGILYAKWNKNSCVAQGTLITLADGTQKAVEELTGNEQLLVWNMLTGTFDTAPILFIDFDSIRTFEIIKLNFSDGTIVKVIDEHAFWDFNLNQYVFVRSDAAKYIGHWFNKQTTDNDGNIIYTKVQLTSVDIYSETTTAWSPVTYGHLCIYVNGMLSMPGATQGLINIFDVNPITMKYDEVAMANDIAQYGLFTYEEFNELVPVSQEVFNAFNGQYLKVAIGKGITTIQQLTALVERYSAFFAN